MYYYYNYYYSCYYYYYNSNVIIIKGMDLATERPHSQYGSAIFVTSGTIVNTTSLPGNRHQQHRDPESRPKWNLSDVSLQTTRWTFQVPPATDWDRRPTAGDHWGRSSTWGYATTNTDGELVEDWAENQRLSLIHDPKPPSSFNSGEGTTLASSLLPTELPGAVTRLLEPVPRSQLRPIEVQVNAAITVQTVPFQRRFNLKKAKWEQYAYQLDAVENIPATAECYDQFVNALRRVARKNIPRGCRRNYVPGLTPESIELIEEYREKYEDDPFADNTHHTRGGTDERHLRGTP